LPKVEISVWVSNQRAQEVADKIAKVARTGRIGDGKIFVSRIDDAIRIRTGERGDAAV